MLGLHPEVCHLNEGHAAFVVLERARSFPERPLQLILAGEARETNNDLHA